ncbi:hypothetical protein ACE3MQ_13305 [Paenibacillus lentus]|uniref:hypothetical protein n=1 Tax=Paenibacillus lentus TaxID=1338368 RepID=UPI0036534DC0
MGFKTSVNIKFDIGNEEFLRRYIPTPSHGEVFKGIIDGFTEEKSNHSHIIIGPYGTGKSLLANVIGTIVSKMARKSDLSALIDKFEQVDDYIAEKIREVSKLKLTYVPILLSGNEGRFRQSVLSTIINKLKEYGIDILLPGLATRIIESINIWEKDYPNTYNSFVLRLKQDGKRLDKWIEEIKQQNEKEISYFSSIYPLFSAGATFDVDYNHSFISQIEYVTEVLERNNIGLFIVYDEFARFLQGLTSEKFSEAMQDIQDLSEISNRTKLIQFLLITHKSLRHYFNVSNEDYLKEFQRIEKRFRQYLIKSDQATFLRVAEIVITENIDEKPQIKPEVFKSIQGSMRKFPLFPSINQTERDKLVIRGMYPLHPVALFLLPSLTRVFGQNERTLFTFLESQETGGFINHISKTDQYYLSHQLFDFFFPDLNDHNTEDVGEHILLYKKALARMPVNIKNKKSALNVIKLITIWNLCEVQNEQKLTTDFLLFASQINEEKLSALLSELSENKIIRFNRINHYWELFSGNSTDLNEKIELEKQLIKLDKVNELDILYKNLPRKYFFPDRYNDEKGMTRFAAIKFICDNGTLEKVFPENVNSDLSIYYVLPDTEDEYKFLDSQLIELSRAEDVLLYLHPRPIQSIRDEIINIITLESLRKNRNLLSEDKGIKEELDLLITESRHEISYYLSELFKYNDNQLWYIDGEKYSISSEVQLASVLTEKCYRLFRHTPIIFNDSFNRNNISGVQRNAAIRLIDHILNFTQLENFGITGNGPEYALFASIFKNNNRFDNNINQLDYRNIQNEHLSMLRNNLVTILENNPSGNFSDIINLFIGPPFGIRKPLIPILLVALLRDRWSEFMLFRNEMYVPGLDGSKLFEIIVETGAEKYEYEYERISNEQIEFFNKIETHSQDSLESRLENKSRLIFIAGTLLKWLRSLPRITQTSEKVQGDFKELRDTIKRSEIHPHQSINYLFDLFHNDFDKFLTLKKYGEEHIYIVESELIRILLETINVKNLNELKEWVVGQKEMGISNKLVDKLHLSLESISFDNWIQQFAESYIGIGLSEWADITFELYKDQLEYDFHELINSSEVENIYSKDDIVVVQLDASKKIINKMDLSVKSTTVYQNLERMVTTAGKNIPRQELHYLIYKLFENYVVKSE